jgi:hypothetical protein
MISPKVDDTVDAGDQMDRPRPRGSQSHICDFDAMQDRSRAYPKSPMNAFNEALARLTLDTWAYR